MQENNPDENAASDGQIVPVNNQLQPNTGDNVRASWKWSLHDVRTNMSHCTAERRKALIDCFLWSIDPKHPTTLAEFAEAVGYDRTVLTRLFQGKYTDAAGKRFDIPEKMAAAARGWLSKQKKKFKGREEFVLTPTAKKIWLLIDVCRQSRTVGFLTGRSHVGKTWALENYSVNNNHGSSPYIRMKAASGLGGMVKRIAAALGISDKGNTAQLIDYIKRALTPDMVLIFDEVHLLMYTYRIGSFFACLEVLREIHDETGCPMVLCATELLLEKMKGGQHTEMEQLLRRGIHKLPLPDMPTRADLEAILGHNGLAFPKRGDTTVVQGITEKPYELLKQLAKVEGLLSITERIRYARTLAERAGKEISWHYFVTADLTIRSNAQQEAGWE